MYSTHILCNIWYEYVYFEHTVYFICEIIPHIVFTTNNNNVETGDFQKLQKKTYLLMYLLPDFKQLNLLPIFFRTTWKRQIAVVLLIHLIHQLHSVIYIISQTWYTVVRTVPT